MKKNRGKSKNARQMFHVEQPGQPTRAGTVDFAAAAAAINPDSRPVPERWILPSLPLEPLNPTSRTPAATVDFAVVGGMAFSRCRR